jgi:hypothetical protein
MSYHEVRGMALTASLVLLSIWLALVTVSLTASWV